MRIYAYIDAFNFYYGLTRNTPYRWCNLAELCKLLFPQDGVEQIKVFFGHARPIPGHEGQPARRKVYLRALQTLPNVQLIGSKFNRVDKKLPIVDKLPRVEYVKVRDYVEKQADVNLASHMLLDAFQDKYDLAAVFTNDSDFVTPIQMVRYELHKKVKLMLTTGGRRFGNKDLMKVANSHMAISSQFLELSQFPDRILDAEGREITKPASW